MIRIRRRNILIIIMIIIRTIIIIRIMRINNNNNNTNKKRTKKNNKKKKNHKRGLAWSERMATRGRPAIQWCMEIMRSGDTEHPCAQAKVVSHATVAGKSSIA